MGKQMDYGGTNHSILEANDTDLEDMATVDGSEIQPLLGSSKKRGNSTGLGKTILHKHAGETSLKVPDQKKADTGSSWVSSVMILANIVLGLGLLNFPKAFADAGGIYQALSIEAVCMIFIVGGLLIMAHCSDLCCSDTYQDVVHYFAGSSAYIVCNVAIFVHNFGTCVAFLVIIGDQLDQVISLVFGPTFCRYWYLERKFTVSVVSLFLILPFLFTKRIDGFMFRSMLGILTTVYILGLSASKFVIQNNSNGVHTVIMHKSETSFTVLFLVIPTICFSFESHIEAVPLYACLKHRTLPQFGRVAFGSTVICLIIYNTVGAFGFLTFGQDVTSDLLLSYTPDVAVLIGMAMAALKAVTTYPSVFFCSRLTVDDLAEFVKDFFGLNWTTSAQQKLLTVLMFFFSLFIAIFVPTISSAIAVLGGSGALFVFVFPGWCCVSAYSRPRSTKQCLMLAVGVVFLVVGVFVAAVTYVQAGVRYSTPEFSQTEVICHD